MTSSANSHVHNSERRPHQAQENLVSDFKNTPGTVQMIIVLLVVVVAVFLYDSFSGLEMSVLEPGLDDGMVYARLYSWWGLKGTAYQLKRMKDDYGHMTWHVRKYNGADGWMPLYGPDPFGNLVMWFPN